ncbi:solute carrier family 15 member 4-like [Haliotis rufescens]|uniref:solute carrier family 15 member 4-like n=1 Tax=Haliotis rufescens TaxID=6454 RepID=UPI00201EF0A7|nr:solute carrier family 15 member 4-like [Haliotis rufescens]
MEDSCDTVADKGDTSRHIIEGDDVGAQKLSWRSVVAAVFILTVEMCERLTYYSVTANQMLFSTSILQLSAPLAVKIHQVFAGTSLILPLFGGYIADCMSGRYNAILGSGFIYVVGLVLIPASAMDYRPLFCTDEDGSQFDLDLTTRRVYYYIALVCIAVGTGGIKATVGPFGAQQVEEYGKGAVRSFFNWFYWFINVGSTIAFTAVAYVQQDISFTWGYVIPLISMVTSLFFLVVTRGFYRHIPPGESSVKLALGVVHEAVRRRGDGQPFFQSPRKRYGGSYDDETVSGVIAFGKVLLLLLPLAGFGACYFQAQSITYLQSLRMDVTLGNFAIPVAAIGIFNTIAVLILIPFVDRVLYPCMERIGRPFTLLKRIGVGMIIAMIGVVVSGVVEIFRKREIATSGGMIQTLGGQDFRSSHYSVFLQIPQIVIGGMSEVFTFVPAFEFGFTQVPSSMQGMMQGAVLALSGLGNYIGTGVLAAVSAATHNDPWLSDDLNTCHAEYLLFLMGGILIIVTVIFTVASLLYRSTPTQDDDVKEGTAH